MPHPTHRRALVLWLCLLGCFGATSSASAEVHREGQWPDDNSERVSLSFEGPRAKAVRELAAAAGWSVIGNPNKPDANDAEDHVNLYVTDQPAAKVLEMLLQDGDYVVKREGKLLSIATKPAGSTPTVAAWPAPDLDPAAAQPLRDADDRTIVGSSAVIKRDEVVNNLTVLGGSTEVFGTVQEDVVVLGGSLKVRAGGHVLGDVTVLGGAVALDDGSRVEGDLSTAGGRIERATGAIVKGEETTLASGRHSAQSSEDDEQSAWSFRSLLAKLGGALSRTALLYVFGCVLLAAIGGPMQRMQHELGEHPMRAFGVGLAAAVGGSFAVLALCVTIIGIPVAVLLVLAGVLGVYAGMCAVLLEIGALVLEERTPSPYAHLAVGCAVYLIFSALPIIGWMATCAAVVCGLGLLINTQIAGLFTGSSFRPRASA